MHVKVIAIFCLLCAGLLGASVGIALTPRTGPSPDVLRTLSPEEQAELLLSRGEIDVATRRTLATLATLPLNVSRNSFTNSFTTSDLTTLHAILEDPKFSDYWLAALKVVSILDSPNEALVQIQKIAEGPVDFQNLEAIHSCASIGVALAKPAALSLLYNLPASIAGPFAKEAATKAGAEKVLKEWARGQLPRTIDYDGLRVRIRYHALYAMATCQDRSWDHYLDSALADLNSPALSDPEDLRIKAWIPEILAYREVVREMGVEKALAQLSNDSIEE